jgi:ABC-2 type transport system permease protein
MKTILLIIQKEFKQIFRTKAMVGILFVMPILQLFVLANALTFDIRNIKMAIINHDNSTLSQKLINKISYSKFFKVTAYPNSSKQAEILLDKSQADLYIEIPNQFEKGIVTEGKSEIAVVVNAIDGTKAIVGFNYFLNILISFQNEQKNSLGRKINFEIKELPKIIEIRSANWFNVKQEYLIFMVPGLVVLLLTLIGGFLTGINIVREKENGTIEQINVSPIKKYQFIIGKLTPFWVIGMFEFFFAMSIAILVYNVPFLGNPAVLITFAAIYLTLVMGIGLLISTISNTQQQALFVTWFFLVVFILLSGFFSPIENMPLIIQNITLFNPLRYFVEVVRLVMLKGSGFWDIKFQLGMTIFYSILINFFAVMLYRKRT